MQTVRITAELLKEGGSGRCGRGGGGYKKKKKKKILFFLFFLRSSTSRKQNKTKTTFRRDCYLQKRDCYLQKPEDFSREGILLQNN